jgi:hypothetical protein
VDELADAALEDVGEDGGEVADGAASDGDERQASWEVKGFSREALEGVQRFGVLACAQRDDVGALQQGLELRVKAEDFLVDEDEAGGPLAPRGRERGAVQVLKSLAGPLNATCLSFTCTTRSAMRLSAA